MKVKRTLHLLHCAQHTPRTFGVPLEALDGVLDGVLAAVEAFAGLAVCACSAFRCHRGITDTFSMGRFRAHSSSSSTRSFCVKDIFMGFGVYV